MRLIMLILHKGEAGKYVRGRGSYRVVIRQRSNHIYILEHRALSRAKTFTDQNGLIFKTFQVI